MFNQINESGSEERSLVKAGLRLINESQLNDDSSTKENLILQQKNTNNFILIWPCLISAQVRSSELTMRCSSNLEREIGLGNYRQEMWLQPLVNSTMKPHLWHRCHSLNLTSPFKRRSSTLLSWTGRSWNSSQVRSPCQGTYGMRTWAWALSDLTHWLYKTIKYWRRRKDVLAHINLQWAITWSASVEMTLAFLTNRKVYAEFYYIDTEHFWI